MKRTSLMAAADAAECKKLTEKIRAEKALFSLERIQLLVELLSGLDVSTTDVVENEFCLVGKLNLSVYKTSFSSPQDLRNFIFDFAFDLFNYIEDYAK